ncbi:hypothetical protein BgiMline_006884 [Biomphalaria glabrata]
MDNTTRKQQSVETEVDLEVCLETVYKTTLQLSRYDCSRYQLLEDFLITIRVFRKLCIAQQMSHTSKKPPSTNAPFSPHPKPINPPSFPEAHVSSETACWREDIHLSAVNL